MEIPLSRRYSILYGAKFDARFLLFLFMNDRVQVVKIKNNLPSYNIGISIQMPVNVVLLLQFAP